MVVVVVAKVMVIAAAAAAAAAVVVVVVTVKVTVDQIQTLVQHHPVHPIHQPIVVV